jgi:membrane-associated phospholipid phosphatase
MMISSNLWGRVDMSDPIPDRSNRFAHWLGRVFHPAVVCVPTLILSLRDLPPAQAIGWTALIASLVIVPGLIVVGLQARRRRYTYQRQTRGPIYVVVWMSVAVAAGVVQVFGGPYVLMVCLVTLLVWLPIQLLINTFVTKISTHVAVIAGCATGLLVLGILNTWYLQTFAVIAVGLTIWARVVTKNHTLPQVVLGLGVGIGCVLVVFPWMLSASAGSVV